MTWQARVWFLVIGGRHSAIAALIWFADIEFPEGSYEVIRQLQPLGRWAWIFLITGVLAFAAAAAGRESLARKVVALSVLGTSCWAFGFIAAGLDGTLVAPTAPVVWTALVLKDLLIASSDLSRPDLTALTARRGSS